MWIAYAGPDGRSKQVAFEPLLRMVFLSKSFPKSSAGSFPDGLPEGFPLAETVAINTPRELLDVGETLRLRPLTPDLLVALLNRLLTWKCPRNGLIGHWSFRALPIWMSQLVSPLVPRKRWEALNPLVFEALLVEWVIRCYGLPTPTDVQLGRHWPDVMATVWNLDALARLDAQLIAPVLQAPVSLLQHPWEALRLKKLLGLFQLDSAWVDDEPPAHWPHRYWLARFERITLPWQALKKVIGPRVGKPADRYGDTSPDYWADCHPALRNWLAGLERSQPARQLYSQRVLVLVEGQTEERLLPMMAAKVGVPPESWQCWPVGGKSQMASVYELAKQVMVIPIVMVLDADAQSLQAELLEKLRPQDRLCLLADGELEDHLDAAWLTQTLNQAYDLYPPLTVDYFAACDGGRVEQLKALWRERQLGVFDKTTLAKLLASSLGQD